MFEVPVEERVSFTSRGIVFDAIGVLKSRWLLFLSWGLVPLAGWAALVFLLHGDVPGLTPGKRGLAVIACLALFLLLTIPFKIRLYRYIVAGDTPSRWYFAQFLEGRTWNFLCGWILLAGKMYFVNMVVSIVVFYVSTGVANLMGGNTLLVSYFSLLAFFVGYMATFSVLAEQMTLLLPDLALDGKGSSDRVTLYSGYARWRMIRIQAVLIGVVSLSSLARVSLELAGVSMPSEVRLSLLAMESLVSLLGFLVFEISASLIYKRMSPSWPGLDLRWREMLRRCANKEKVYEL